MPNIDDFDPSVFVGCPYPNCEAKPGELCVFDGKARLGTHYARRRKFTALRRGAARRAKARRREILESRNPTKCHACGQEKPKR